MYAHIIMNCTATYTGDKTANVSTGAQDAGRAESTPQELKQGLLQALFDAASKEDALEVNRRKIYKLWREEGGGED